MTAMNMNKTELNTEALETVTGGTPMSIPGGKRSGRKNMETALEIMQRVGDWGTGILESLGLKVIRFFDYEVDRDFERVCRHISVVTEERCSALS